MAREYFHAYHSYLEAMAALNDAECGRLFKACLIYSKTGEAPELRGNERFVFHGLKSQIDRDAKVYMQKCEKNRENALQRYTPACDGMRAPAKPAKEKEGEKEKHSPLYPPMAGESPDACCGAEAGAGGGTFSPGMQAALRRWMAYKSERRQAYKGQGKKALMEKAKQEAEQHGDAAVIAVIDESIANGYAGITWDRLERQAKANPALNYPQRKYTEADFKRMGFVPFGDDEEGEG